MKILSAERQKHLGVCERTSKCLETLIKIVITDTDDQRRTFPDKSEEFPQNHFYVHMVIQLHFFRE